mgnify:FL=1
MDTIKISKYAIFDKLNKKEQILMMLAEINLFKNMEEIIITGRTISSPPIKDVPTKQKTKKKTKKKKKEIKDDFVHKVISLQGYPFENKVGYKDCLNFYTKISKNRGTLIATKEEEFVNFPVDFISQ